ncbi:MAG: DUF4198 domain-containing protein [Planctomycetia bacterium]|nr:DUF4198 domain-containing protein [Planctomycetia bacterium]
MSSDARPDGSFVIPFLAAAEQCQQRQWLKSERLALAPLPKVEDASMIILRFVISTLPRTYPMQRTVFLSLVLLTVSSLSAHEIKVLASNQQLGEAGGKTTVFLSWGHRLPIDDLVDSATIARYDLVAPDGKATALKLAEKSLQTNVVELKEPGVHQVAVARKYSTYTYIFDEEGQRQLKRGSKLDQGAAKIDAATKSLQCAKAMITVGKPSDKGPLAAGLPIEIIPLDGPAKWTNAATLRFQVLLEGKPLSTAEVVARPIGFKPDNAWNYATMSNRKGEFNIVASQAGTWVIKVHTQRLATGKVREEYDFESFTATLSLEVAP